MHHMSLQLLVISHSYHHFVRMMSLCHVKESGWIILLYFYFLFSQSIRPAMQAASEAEGKTQEDFSPLAMFAFFVNRVKENLHIIIAFSPIGDAFRNRLRQFPSLINCCTIDWFQVCRLRIELLLSKQLIWYEKKRKTTLYTDKANYFGNLELEMCNCQSGESNFFYAIQWIIEISQWNRSL